MELPLPSDIFLSTALWKEIEETILSLCNHQVNHHFDLLDTFNTTIISNEDRLPRHVSVMRIQMMDPKERIKE